MKEINIKILIIGLFLCSSIGCDKKDPPCLSTECEEEDPCPDIYEVNSNIVPIPNTAGCYSSIWVNDSTIICPHAIIKVDNDINIISNNGTNIYGKIGHKDHTNQKLLIIYRDESNKEYTIKEYTIANNTSHDILSTNSYITDALYFRDNGQILFSILNDEKIELFLYDKFSQKKEYLFSYPWNCEGFKSHLSIGIDIHPKENILLIPFIANKVPPKLLKYQIDTKQVDTLNINFDFRNKNEYLWVRYSPTGEKILFCHYDSESAYGISDIGIIDMNTFQKTILDLNTGKTMESLNLYPSWSPNGKHIVFSSASVFFCKGKRGTPHFPYPNLFIRKNID